MHSRDSNSTCLIQTDPLPEAPDGVLPLAIPVAFVTGPSLVRASESPELLFDVCSGSEAPNLVRLRPSPISAFAPRQFGAMTVTSFRRAELNLQSPQRFYFVLAPKWPSAMGALSVLPKSYRSAKLQTWRSCSSSRRNSAAESVARSFDGNRSGTDNGR